MSNAPVTKELKNLLLDIYTSGFCEKCLSRIKNENNSLTYYERLVEEIKKINIYEDLPNTGKFMMEDQ